MQVDVAIVGAGIAGLYAGLRLARMSKPLGTLAIFEASEHVGGRIWTDRSFEPDFALEFGPMRIELDVAPLLRKLLADLDFNLQDDLAPFPPPTSPEVKNPTYDLQGEERQNGPPIQLLELALRRIFTRVRVLDPHECPRNGPDYRWSDGDLRNIKGLNAKLDILASDLRRSQSNDAAEWRKIFARWISSLDEGDYQDIREYAVYGFSEDEPGGAPLWQFGFWNLLSDVLSHGAVRMLPNGARSGFAT